MHDTFRDELASVAPDGRRRWIYARQPSGGFYRARTIVAIILLGFLCGAPLVTVNGLPLVLLDVVNRRFALFGLLFWPQDFHLVVLIALLALVTLALTTAAIGRVWCGWLCPQTVFMEMVFRRIEFLIDGSAEQQMRRHRGPWTFDRIWRTVLKQTVFFGVSFFIANLFLAWVIGAGPLWRIVTDPPREHLTGLAMLTTFSLVFYAVFARFREQACILACPYGRVMSSLVDRRTITVTYDTGRGEPRGRMTADSVAANGQGDCIDCRRCVTVCPTGIDIRNGIQLECVACTACIDACDDVMTRIDRPCGLIRYTSHDAVPGATAEAPVRDGAGMRTSATVRPRRLASPLLTRGRLTSRLVTPRLAAYGTVWLLLIAAAGVLLARRPATDVLILRQAGSLFAQQQNGDVVNLFTVQVFNRSAQPRELWVRAVSPEGASVRPLAPFSRVGAHAMQEGQFLLTVPRANLEGLATRVRFEVTEGGAAPRIVESSVIGPGEAVPASSPTSSADRK
jgi:cytochrome c oxidase accessory protein FixG